MTPRTLDLGELQLPALEAQTSTLVVYGGKGMGKTNFIAVLAEECGRCGLRFAWLDPVGVAWGLKHSGDGRGPGVEVLILGGIHGDIAIEPTAGGVVADLVVDEDVSVIIDISRRSDGRMWTNGEKIRFVRDYCIRLFERQGERRRPLLQIIDEAGRFVPQSIPAKAFDIAECLGAIEQLVELGRNVGVGVALVTQRSARMNKSVSELADMMVAFRTVGPRSIDAIVDWFGEHVPREKQRGFVEHLRELDVGTALVVSPGWLKIEGRFALRARRTFDSSSTPVAGKEQRPTGKGATVDLAKYSERMAETIERAEADDPKALRKRITELERQAATQKRAAAPPPPPAAEVEVLIEHVPETVSEALAAIAKHSRETAESAAFALTKSRDLEKLIVRINNKPTRTRAPDRPGRPAARLPSPPRTPARAATPPPPPAPPGADADVKLKAGARRMIETLARQHPMRLTRRQLGLLANVKASGGTFGDYLSVMRVNGLVDLDGDFVDITEAGFAAAGMVPSDPLTTDAIIAMYQSKLKAGARRMLDVIVEMWPDIISREDLGARAGVEPSGGTFGDYLSVMCTNGLAEKVDEDGRPHPKGNYVRAGEALHLDQ